MPRNIIAAENDLFILNLECKTGRLNTEIVDNQIPVVLERLSKAVRQAHDAFIDKKELQLPRLSAQILNAAAKLAFLSEQRLEEIAEEKIRYAPHPTFIS